MKKLLTLTLFSLTSSLSGESPEEYLVCEDNLYRLDSAYRWAESTGYIYTGYFPYIYTFTGNRWYYFFTDPDSGAYLYDFSRMQFGYFACEYFPYYIVLPTYNYPEYYHFTLDYPSYPSLPVANIRYEVFSGMPTIDGIIESYEWEGARNYGPQEINTVVSGEAVEAFPAPMGKWYAMWDEYFLYLLVEVQSDMWYLDQYTQLEIYTSASFNRRWGSNSDSGFDGISDASIIISSNFDKMKVSHGLFSYGAQNTEIEEILVESVLSENGPLFEIAIPWEFITGGGASDMLFSGGYFYKEDNQVSEKNYLGIEIVIQSSYPGTPLYRTAWSGGTKIEKGDTAWHSPGSWGTLILSILH